MKKLLLIALLIVGLHCVAVAQKVEVSLQVNSGLYHYSGAGAASETYIADTYQSENNFTYNPYGKHYDISNGAGINVKWNIKNKFSVGLLSTFEVSKSRMTITGFQRYVSPFYDYIAYTVFTPTKAAGDSYLTSKFVTLSPYIGYLLNFKHLSLDIMPGADIGIGLISYENSSIVVDNEDKARTTHRQRAKPPTDVRARLGAALNYHRFSINAAYARGFTNYGNNLPGNAKPKVYTELFRFGLGYRIL